MCNKRKFVFIGNVRFRISLNGFTMRQKNFLFITKGLQHPKPPWTTKFQNVKLQWHFQAFVVKALLLTKSPVQFSQQSLHIITFFTTSTNSQSVTVVQGRHMTLHVQSPLLSLKCSFSKYSYVTSWWHHWVSWPWPLYTSLTQTHCPSIDSFHKLTCD